MGYSKRLKILFSHLKRADTFADVGCDHGYATEYALKNGLCKTAVFSD
ncbi:MAG: tRNA (adenine(22)-N(1))-methyltransferase TrmK, partial [Clostridia bacterium]|nr:tRNA (adenine(22)-N(1))-methyltransferase TrmK [Clostridia bacterium]